MTYIYYNVLDITTVLMMFMISLKTKNIYIHNHFIYKKMLLMVGYFMVAFHSIRKCQFIQTFLLHLLIGIASLDGKDRHLISMI